MEEGQTNLVKVDRNSLRSGRRFPPELHSSYLAQLQELP
jgi:hypothetical protein